MVTHTINRAGQSWCDELRVRFIVSRVGESVPYLARVEYAPENSTVEDKAVFTDKIEDAYEHKTYGEAESQIQSFFHEWHSMKDFHFQIEKIYTRG